MSGLQGQHVCVLCKRGRPTKEHLIPVWLRDLFLVPHDDTVSYSYSDYRPADDRIWTASAADLTARRVCGPCNNGWLSALEARAQPVLRPLLAGATCALNSRSQEILALWLTKTVFMLRLGQPGVGIRPALYGDLYRTRQPPPLTRVWIGTCREVGPDVLYRFQPLLARVPDLEADDRPLRPQAYIATLKVGALVAKVYGQFDPSVRVGLLLGRFSDALIQIWPIEVTPAPWPPGHALALRELPMVLPPAGRVRPRRQR